MYGTDMHLVLRCEQCNKPFDKQSTLKRHGYYCRSRKGGAVTPRSRSCISCVKAKARCDNKRPDCSRCIGKGAKCHYPVNASRGSKSKNQRYNDKKPSQQGSAVSTPVDDHSSTQGSQGTESDAGLLVETPINLPAVDFVADLEGEYFAPDIDFTNFLDPQPNDLSFQYTSPETFSLARQSITNISIPPVPTNSLRSFYQRPKLKIGAQRTANLVLHTLKSYPLMMLRDNALPPFIHPHLISSDIENKDLEPLNNCISLMRMLGSQVHGSRRLFWKNVRMECERLCADHMQLNKWELLAAMQALSIYILTRLDEGETDHNDFDSLLVTAVIVVAAQFNSIHIANNTNCATDDSKDLETSWKDWILEESARRLCVVYQVVNMLVYFEPAAMCDLHQTELLLAPLPAKKQLWEASDELMWKSKSEWESIDLQASFGLATNGDLVRLDQDGLYCGGAPMLPSKSSDEITKPVSTANWEEWCSGMDGLGGLVMLAASLVA